ncbi:Hypothetical protein D9617_10g072360 [Elsinoe fawcettii]|nr:Hypothetical protein D9617_10g072360 [Elsinoe fawcettii]
MRWYKPQMSHFFDGLCRRRSRRDREEERVVQSGRVSRDESGRHDVELGSRPPVNRVAPPDPVYLPGDYLSECPARSFDLHPRDHVVRNSVLLPPPPAIRQGERLTRDNLEQHSLQLAVADSQAFTNVIPTSPRLLSPEDCFGGVHNVRSNPMSTHVAHMVETFDQSLTITASHDEMHVRFAECQTADYGHKACQTRDPRTNRPAHGGSPYQPRRASHSRANEFCGPRESYVSCTSEISALGESKYDVIPITYGGSVSPVSTVSNDTYKINLTGPRSLHGLEMCSHSVKYDRSRSGHHKSVRDHNRGNRETGSVRDATRSETTSMLYDRAHGPTRTVRPRAGKTPVQLPTHYDDTAPLRDSFTDIYFRPEFDDGFEEVELQGGSTVRQSKAGIGFPSRHRNNDNARANRDFDFDDDASSFNDHLEAVVGRDMACAINGDEDDMSGWALNGSGLHLPGREVEVIDRFGVVQQGRFLLGNNRF